MHQAWKQTAHSEWVHQGHKEDFLPHTQHTSEKKQNDIVADSIIFSPIHKNQLAFIRSILTLQIIILAMIIASDMLMPCLRQDLCHVNEPATSLQWCCIHINGPKSQHKHVVCKIIGKLQSKLPHNKCSYLTRWSMHVWSASWGIACYAGYCYADR